MTESAQTPERPCDRFTLHADQCQLMLIDLQDRLLPVIQGGEEVLRKSQIMLDIAEAMGIPVILTEQYPEGLGPTAAQLRFANPPQKIRKLSFSAASSELLAKLEKAGRRQLIVAGAEAHVCVFQTVRQLLEAGFRVFVLQDAVSSRTIANKENALQLMREMGAVVTNLETVLFDLLKQAGTPLFKQLSKLIR
jgi:nicotinamidase-related amidase